MEWWWWVLIIVHPNFASCVSCTKKNLCQWTDHSHRRFFSFGYLSVICGFTNVSYQSFWFNSQFPLKLFSHYYTKENVRQGFGPVQKAAALYFSADWFFFGLEKKWWLPLNCSHSVESVNRSTCFGTGVCYYLSLNNDNYTPFWRRLIGSEGLL